VRQVVQNLKTGAIELAELPAPSPRPGEVLVRTVASLISAGTERATIAAGRQSLFDRARRQPDKVIDMLGRVRRDGLAKTVETVQAAFERLQPMGYCNVGTVIGLGASELDDYARAAAQEQGRVLRPDPEPEKGFYYRSDHFNFAKQGIPAFDPDAGIDYVDKPAGFGLLKRDEYTANDYHKPSDEIKPDWDLSGAVEDLKLFVAMGYRVAQASRFPEWRPGNEFRAVREKQLGR